ncbi:MAG TPA: phosphatidylcholine synthase [Reyranella sp.]|nr:phosphatidylcholine synthase [Reyranella sp.]
MLPLRWKDLAAASVHLFTALGAVCGLLAALAAFDGAWERMFAWLGLALIIDGIDGTFARMAHVEERLPRFSGERLDLVVDYVTYVFVPALALLRAGYLTGTAGLVIAALILLSSLYHFSDLASKGEDYSFIGFPAVWNIVAFYVFALSPPAWLTYAILIACVVLTFVPMHWVHPMRVKRLQGITLGTTVAWSIAAIAAVWHGFPPPLWTQVILVIAAFYVCGLTLERSLRPRWEE